MISRSSHVYKVAATKLAQTTIDQLGKHTIHLLFSLLSLPTYLSDIILKPFLPVHIASATVFHG